MAQKANHESGPQRRSSSSERKHLEPITPDSPRFHIFLIDTGWNGPVSKVLRNQLPLFHQYHPQDPLYMLTPEQSVKILKNAPEHIGLDPILVVYDLLSPRDATGDRRRQLPGVPSQSRLDQEPRAGLQRLQHFLRFITLNRAWSASNTRSSGSCTRRGWETGSRCFGKHRRPRWSYCDH